MDPPSVTFCASFSASTELTQNRRLASAGGNGSKVGATGMELQPVTIAKLAQIPRLTQEATRPAVSKPAGRISGISLLVA